MDNTSVKPDVPTYLKFTIGIDEAAEYYGIGEKKLRQIVYEHPDGEFYLEVGRRVLLKRQKFEEFLNQSTTL